MENSILNYIENIQYKYGSNLDIIDLTKLGTVASCYSFSIDLETGVLSNRKRVDEDLEDLFEFVRGAFTYIGVRPFWYNDENKARLVGAGFMERFTEWFDFVLNYIITDRTSEDGNSTFAMVDLKFDWAISIQLSVEEESLIVKHIKN